MTNLERRRAMARMKRINESKYINSEIDVSKTSGVDVRYIIIAKYLGDDEPEEWIRYVNGFRFSLGFLDFKKDIESSHLFYNKEEAVAYIDELPDKFGSDFRNNNYLFEIHEVKVTIKDDGNVETIIK